MDSETQQDIELTDSSEAEQYKMLLLVESAGNREVLLEWIESRESYEYVADPAELGTVAFDCLICDVKGLWDNQETLLERNRSAELVLPYVLLVDSGAERQVRERFRSEQPALWRTVNAVVDMPIPEYRLDDQIETLLQMREQSGDLLEQQKQLRAIRDEHAGHGVVITDRSGTIEYVNKAFENQSGYDRNEVVGKEPSLLQSGEHDEAFYEDLWETIMAGEVWQGEVINEGKDGEQYVLDQTIAPVKNQNGEIERFIAVNHETTHLKELERSLRGQREQLQILNRVLRHDIRNDLHVMLGWADALRDHIDEEGAEYLDRIQRSGEHIVELTEVAKEISEEIYAGEDLDLKAVDLVRTLEEEVQKRNATFENADIELEETPEETQFVWANEMLASVFRNLINNAVQHNDRDTPHVAVSVTVEPDSVAVSVADNGPGIPPEMKADMFDREQKGLDSSGTGMGLFLIESLVDAYGGDITVSDNSPRGTVFTISLEPASQHGGDGT